MPLERPKPTTSKEYLIHIYDAVAEMQADIAALAAHVQTQNGCIKEMERFQERVTGAAKLGGAAGALYAALRVLNLVS